MKLWHLTMFLVLWTICDARKKKNRPASPEKCEKWVGKFDKCLSDGYKPRHFKSCQEEDAQDELEDNKTCRRLEIRIKKRCSYTCQPILMPGGVYEVDVEDENVVRVANVAVMELKNRAVRLGALDEHSTIIRGDVVKAMQQVVSGQRYFITMRLGISDKSECKEAANDQIVSSIDCSHAENMGTYRFQVIDASWRTPRYTFEAMEDVEGPEMTEKYWEKRQPENMLGGVYEVDVEDENVVQVAEIAVKELKNRAVRLGALDEHSTIIRGEIVKAMQQVVSGQRYFITMRLGISDNSECKEAAHDQIVSSLDCSHAENMGTYRFKVIDAVWRSPRYTFEEMEDVEGPEMREKYWEKSKSDIS